MVPDIDLIGSLLTNQDPNWISITLRGIGEMEDQQTLTNIDPARSWVDLSSETDQWGMRRAYVNLVATPNDRQLWQAMDKSAFDLALKLAGNNPANMSTGMRLLIGGPAAASTECGGWWLLAGPPGHNPSRSGHLFMGAPGASITDSNGKFHGTDNVYVAGPALFPILGSANPSLTGLALARRTARAIVARTSTAPGQGFTALSLAPADWQMVKQPNSPATMLHYGSVLETSGWYGLYWYIKETFNNFILMLDWRISRREENSGIYIRVPPPRRRTRFRPLIRRVMRSRLISAALTRSVAPRDMPLRRLARSMICRRPRPLHKSRSEYGTDTSLRRMGLAFKSR